MSDTTFEALWRRLLLYFPELPVALAQEFVNTAYSRALARKHWSALRGYGEFVIPATYSTGTASAAVNDTAVGGNGTTWTTAMVGRQIYFGGTGPYYTVVRVDSPGDLVLDRPYGGTEDLSNGTYTIELIYLPVPSDFLSLLSVRDIDNNWKLYINRFSQEQIDSWDSQRSTSGTPWLIVPAAYSTAVSGTNTPSTVPTPRYEIWPRSGGTKRYSFEYIKQIPLLSAASDRPIFPLRGDVLRHGALAELAMWPGTRQLQNPYFSTDQHSTHEDAFDKGLNAIEVEDENIAQTMIRYHSDMPYAPFDAAWLQSHGGIF